jgi:formylmethanofuran dehydrogenase subunit E
MLCLIPEKLLKEAVKFHGHLGVYLVLGLKAGLYANEILGKNYFDTHACIETEPFPPRSCFLDGIQLTTGCTMGKCNIEIRNGDSLLVRFTQGDRQLTLSVKLMLLEGLSRTTLNESEEVVFSLINKPIEELFDVR